MRISKEIKEIAKEIHKAEHIFVEGKCENEHKLEDYYYLLGSLVMKKILDKIEESHIEIFNKIVDLQNRFFHLEESMKEVSKQQKYLWQSLEESVKENKK